MATLRRINPPVIAFAISICVGWGVSIYLDEWWWLAVGLTLGLVAGDLVAALMPKPAPPKSKPKGPNRDG